MADKGKRFITNGCGETVEFCSDAIVGDLSLKAIGLYFCLLYGARDVDFLNEEYREAFEELWAKNYLQYSLKQR